MRASGIGFVFAGQIVAGWVDGVHGVHDPL
jgi:hypothetical protein